MKSTFFYPGAVSRMETLPDGTDFIAVLQEGDVVLADGATELPRFQILRQTLAGCSFWSIGRIGAQRCCAVRIPAALPLPAGVRRTELRPARLRLDPAFDVALCRARTLSFWKKQHACCGLCGAELTFSGDECALICSSCGARSYPQIAPAVIAAVNDPGGRLLLAHNRKFKPGLFGLVAGFVEAGETLEEAVRREVLEETGVTITRLEYVASQSWPYPNSLMIGFRALTLDDSAHPDGVEISEADFFSRTRCPEIPAPGSIARRLIEEWLAGTVIKT